MNNPYKAYAQAATRVLTPAARDAAALREAVKLLRAAQANFDDDLKVLAAIQKNQLLWAIFIENVTHEECGFDKETRENIATLGAFVIKQGQKVLIDRDSSLIDQIITININLAEGLETSPDSHEKAAKT